MPGDDPDWNAAVRSKTMDALKSLISFGQSPPSGSLVQEACVTAAFVGAMEALTLLLEWGTPANSKDLAGRPALHAAAEAGNAKAVKLLCARGAAVEALDPSGRSPIMLAIAKVHMPAVKELLLAGAHVPDNCSAPGLAAIIKEVQTELHIASLKKIAQSTQEVTQSELNSIDQRVWEVQREHMRLLRLREEQRAGRHLESFQQRTAAEFAAAERAKAEEAEHQKFMANTRVEILAKKNRISEQTRDLNGLNNEEAQVRAKDDKLKAELSERQRRLDVLLSEIEARDASVESEEAAIEEAHRKFALAQRSLDMETDATARLREKLQDARQDLEGWKKDREAAAKLTAKAHRLLDH